MPSPLSVSAKLILFGEWGILNGFTGVGCTLNKTFSTTIETQNKAELCLQTSTHEEVFNSESILHYQDSFFKFFLGGAQCMAKNWPQDLLHHKIKLNCNWNHKEGLGSSSAALLNGALVFQPEALHTPLLLWEKLLPCLQELQGGKGSGFDLALHIFGGALAFRKNKPAESLNIEFPKQLFLLHSGKKWDTSVELKSRKFDPAFFEAMGKVSETFIQNKNWQESISEAHLHLQKAGIISFEQNETMNNIKIQSKSDLVWKTCGAGGGDSLLCWSQNPEAVMNEAKAFGFWSTYPLCLGTKPQLGTL